MEKMSLIGVNHPSMSALMTGHEFVDILLSTSSKVYLLASCCILSLNDESDFLER